MRFEELKKKLGINIDENVYNAAKSLLDSGPMPSGFQDPRQQEPSLEPSMIQADDLVTLPLAARSLAPKLVGVGEEILSKPLVANEIGSIGKDIFKVGKGGVKLSGPKPKPIFTTEEAKEVIPGKGLIQRGKELLGDFEATPDQLYDNVPVNDVKLAAAQKLAREFTKRFSK